MKKKILIIGGMGPQANITLHQKIIQRCTELGAKHGDDFPFIVNLSIPVPESIHSKNEIQCSFDVVKEHLYCLWQNTVYARSYCV